MIAKTIKIIGWSVIGAIALGCILGAIFNPRNAHADISNPHPTPPANSVTNVMLQQGIILDGNVNGAANVSATKITGSPTQDGLLIFNNATLATSTNFKVSTTSAVLYVVGGTIAATSTNFNGVQELPPSSDGAAGQLLQANGNNTETWVNPTSISTQSTFTAGDQIIAGNAVYVATSTNWQDLQVNNDSAAVDDLTGCGVNQLYNNQKFIPPFDETVTGIRVNLKKVGSPADSFVIMVEGNSSGIPNLIPVATSSISGASLTTSYAQYIMPFNKPVYLAAGVPVQLVLGRSNGTVDGSNCYHDELNSNNKGGWAFLGNYFAGAWTSNGAQDLAFSMIATTTAGQVYNTSARTVNQTQTFVGFANTTCVVNTSCAIITSGIVSTTTNFTLPNLYAANNEGQFSSAAGTVTKKIGVAVSTSAVEVTNIW